MGLKTRGSNTCRICYNCSAGKATIYTGISSPIVALLVILVLLYRPDGLFKNHYEVFIEAGVKFNGKLVTQYSGINR